MPQRPFWETKSLAQMLPQEWEALCDGCGKCCLVKLEDADTGDTYFTDAACFMLDGHSCGCKNYAQRKRYVPDCIIIQPRNLDEIGHWLPPSCAYRRLNEGRGLPSWHPLLTGDPDSVHKAGMSARDKTVSERAIAEDDWQDRIVDWPMVDKP